jgi:hypothetical protein
VSEEEKEQPKPWYKSENIRKNVYLGLTAGVTLVKFFGYDRKFGLGVDLVSTDSLADLVMFVLVPVGVAVTAIWIAIWGVLRRIKNGKDPNHPSAAITTPTPVAAAVRFSRDVGIIKGDPK